jgi:hypothetical protein
MSILRRLAAVGTGVAIALVSMGSGPSTPPDMAPLGFNPVTASSAQLLAHHFPLKPKGAQAAKAWVRAMEHAKYVVTKPLEAHTDWTAGQPLQNWSGNIDNGSSDYTAVYMSWVVPKVSGNAGDSSVIWAGIGGQYGGGLDQAGTYQQVSAGGTYYYQAFTESLPQQTTSVAQFPVHPGDTIYVAISSYNTSYTDLFIEDETSGYVADPQVSAVPNRFSAEYILERPEYHTATGCLWYPLANFGTTSISQAAADAGSGLNTVEKFMGNWQHTYDYLVDDSGERQDKLGSITAGGSSNPFYFVAAGDTDIGACLGS